MPGLATRVPGMTLKSAGLHPFPGRLERQRKEIRDPAQEFAKRPLACDGADTRSRFAASLPWIPDLLPLTLQSSGKRWGNALKTRSRRQASTRSRPDARDPEDRDPEA